MHHGYRRPLSWPAAFAILFVGIPPLLFHWHPSSIWANTDYESHGFGDALNLAYRLADLKLYPTLGLADHPGVPFYFMSWLALAATGFPVASKAPVFFDTVVGHVEIYHRIGIWLAALAGASGVYIFACVARKLVPVWVVAIGLLAWLASTPATLLMFTTPSIESFALLINALFFWALVQIAYDRDVSRRTTLIAAGVSAFAYLNKLSYINVSLALAAAGILNLFLRNFGWRPGVRRCLLFTATSLAVIIVVGCLCNGPAGFAQLLRFHRGIVFSSGLYGNGDQLVVSANDIWNAFAAIPRDKAYAMLVAPVIGGMLAIAGVLASRTGAEHIPLAVICTGTGLASGCAAAFVFKHYEIHYTAGVSSTLPASAVGLYLLVQSWGYRPRMMTAAIVTLTILTMAFVTVPRVISELSARAQKSEWVKADLQDLQTQLTGNRRAVAFLYKVPFSWFGEGFAVTMAGVPRLTDEYRQSRPTMFSIPVAGAAGRDVGAYVIDKNYFPTAESVKAAENLTLLETKPVTYENGDKIIELRTVFLLVRR